ncbi:uncharacterized protein BDZ99DRAFT_514402 [Mytilinidion resinicola]|uniref:Uncharacterized protein n=1 Tax=Mytilinidion resinicola TaxID=574789 RepID=A0A6A6Z3V2_9PEZI|nr:uncharacterized protein BDZ99DRAFT_514402 [Mytilinidion resinicola]KAF2815756.1 hypothetical protein BDZ99DRAFT_514402 [Mytilinidion resinicola]
MPIACMVWLLIAVGLVLLMKESIEIYDGYSQKLDHNIWGLICLPYSFAPKQAPLRISNISTLPTVDVANHDKSTPRFQSVDTRNAASNLAHSQVHHRLPMPDFQHSDTIASYDSSFIRTTITMPSNFGLHSWRWYEAIIESLAVGIYL